MTISIKTACVFGGTGFIGTQVVRELAKAGYRVKVATRVPERAFFLRPCGSVGQVVPVACDYGNDESLAKVIEGCDAVVNCIGILFEKGRRRKFKTLHAELPGRIAAFCAEKKVRRLVHISALGSDAGKSRYSRTKRAGEEAVLEKFPAATILRPSVVFGPGDGFFAMFARLAVYAPALPLIGGGKTKFQPVYVGDVADAVMAALTLPVQGEFNPQGRIYELGGPDVMSFKEVYDIVLAQTGRNRCFVNLPWGMAKVQGVVMSMLPKPMLTADQVESLKTDNVVTGQQPGLAHLGVNATSVSTILPSYLSGYRPGGRFADKKSA